MTNWQELQEQLRKPENTASNHEDVEKESNAEQESNEAAEENAAEEGQESLTYETRKALEDKLTAAEQKLEEYREQALRAKAEMENIRRRAERDVASAYKFSIEKLINDLLPVSDSLIRGLEVAGEENEYAQSLREGMKLTLEILEKTLHKHGVEVVAPEKGAAFNPELHQAMSMVEDASAAANTILQTLQKGYVLNGRVLRAAMVIVAK